MKAVGAGVREVRVREASGAFRVIYLATLPDRVLVERGWPGYGAAMRRRRQDHRLNRRREGREGWVYVFSNPSYPNLHKIGRTTGDPKARASELHGTGVPTPFRVELALWVNDCATLEQWVHGHLAKDREYRGREFFRTSLQNIVASVELGVSENRLLCYRDHDPNGLLAGTRARWARAAAAQAEANRKARIEAAEADRRARIERELKEEILEARRPVEALRPRAAVIAGALLTVAAISTIASAYEQGAGGWTIVLGFVLWWIVSGTLLPATNLVLKAFSKSGKQRERQEIGRLLKAASDAVNLGADSLVQHLKTQARKSVLRCTGCSVRLRIETGRSGLVRCPKCGKLDHYDTRS